MNTLLDVGPYWLLLTGLNFTMVYGGGIEWIHRRDGMDRFAHVPVAVWKRLHQLVWILGTVAFAIGIVIDLI